MKGLVLAGAHPTSTRSIVDVYWTVKLRVAEPDAPLLLALAVAEYVPVG